jgi:hypothetical protein
LEHLFVGSLFLRHLLVLGNLVHPRELVVIEAVLLDHFLLLFGLPLLEVVLETLQAIVLQVFLSY